MSQTESWFKNRVCILATMHKKEQVMVRPLEAQLQMQVIIPQAFNTDSFGTFSREIKRMGTQLEAARLKAQQVLEVTGESLAVTSEGSFFPHPILPYCACDRELVLLLDKTNDIEIVGTEISLETNYSHTSVKTVSEALAFAEKAGFPSHGLIVMESPKPQKNEMIFKGIVTEEKLINAVTKVMESSPKKTAHVETDMRAMYNPSRMKVIAQATHNLIEKILNTCPNCNWPGFDIIETIPGLTCEICHFPTDLIKSEIYQCKKCNFQQTKDFPNGVKFADPTYCNYCNP